jgi:hypothetical protein
MIVLILMTQNYREAMPGSNAYGQEIVLLLDKEKR